MDCLPSHDTLGTSEAPSTLHLANDGTEVVEAVGIEHPAIHLIQTILERFRGQVSAKALSNNTNKTRYRTFL
jgi:hypothetical protein